MAQTPATWKFTTARSSFDRTIAREWHRCSGCGHGIAVGQPVMERDFIVKKKIEGKTRLHDNDDCCQEWELKVLEAIAARKERRGW